MRPVVIDTCVEINARPEQVWPYLVDWDHLGDWMKEGKNFKVTSPHREGVGVTAEADISIAGITTVDPIRTIRWEPPHLLEIEHLGWVGGRGRIQCARSAEGTLVSWKETLEPPWGLLGALGIRLVEPLMKRVFQRDLHLLKRLVESRAQQDQPVTR